MNGCFYTPARSAPRRAAAGHDDVYDEFVDKLRTRMQELNIGDPADEETDMGPLCNEGTLSRVVEHVEDARSAGAEVEQFGPEEELYYLATILTGVTPEMQIMREETFGPVAPIMRVHRHRKRSRSRSRAVWD